MSSRIAVTRSLFILFASLSLARSGLSAADSAFWIEEEISQYFHPLYIQKQFYDTDQIVLHEDDPHSPRQRFSREDLEQVLLSPIYRFPTTSHAPSEISRIGDRSITGYTPRERKEAFALEESSQSQAKGHSLTAEEKEALRQKISREMPIRNDKYVDEAEGLALVSKPAQDILSTFLKFDDYDIFPVVKNYLKHAEQLSEHYIRSNHTRSADELIGELRSNNILPLPPDVYYQYSRVQIQKPDFFHTLRFEVKRTEETVSRGEGNRTETFENLPTLRVFWAIDPYFNDHSLFGRYGIFVNSGYLQLQPYINAEGEIFDGPGGFPGPDQFITMINYHIYIKFDPSVPQNDVSGYLPRARETTIGNFIENMVVFLRNN
ncbi:MAG: hypothetical protein HY391_05865 [Deltaproteobacteria bacterium]|nr:hypothetical protein [Deltaproteobacteria bacterium]